MAHSKHRKVVLARQRAHCMWCFETQAEVEAQAEAEAAEGALERAMHAERAMEVDAEPPSPQQRLQERVKTIFAELQAAGSPPNEAAAQAFARATSELQDEMGGGQQPTP